MVGRLFRYIGYLVVLAAVGLIVYAYVGPFLGVDFSPPQVEVTKPVTLNVD